MKKYVIVLIFLVPLQLFPQSREIDNYTNGIDLYWLGLGYTSYDKEIADHEGFKESTVPLEFRLGGFFKKYFVIGGSATLGFPKDLRPFFNTLTGGARAESDVTIPQLALYGGIKTKPIGKSNKLITGILLFGNDWITNARRGIDGCANCTTQDFDMESGLYLQPEINYEYHIGDDLPMSAGIALGYKYYFGGDVNSSVIFSTYIRTYGIKW